MPVHSSHATVNADGISGPSESLVKSGLINGGIGNYAGPSDVHHIGRVDITVLCREVVFVESAVVHTEQYALGLVVDDVTGRLGRSACGVLFEETGIEEKFGPEFLEIIVAASSHTTYLACVVVVAENTFVSVQEALLDGNGRTSTIVSFSVIC